MTPDDQSAISRGIAQGVKQLRARRRHEAYARMIARSMIERDAPPVGLIPKTGSGERFAAGEGSDA